MRQRERERKRVRQDVHTESTDSENVNHICTETDLFFIFNVNSFIFVIYWTVNNQEAVNLIFFMGLFLFTVLRYFIYLLLLGLFGVTFIHAE